MSTWDAVPDPDDERPVDDAAELVLPDRLEAPLEAPEADAVDQSIEVALDDEDE
jgi:hypothetical protein